MCDSRTKMCDAVRAPLAIMKPMRFRIDAPRNSRPWRLENEIASEMTLVLFTSIFFLLFVHW